MFRALSEHLWSLLGQAAGFTAQYTQPAKHEVVLSFNLVLSWRWNVPFYHIDLVLEELACQGRGCEKPVACPPRLVDFVCQQLEMTNWTKTFSLFYFFSFPFLAVLFTLSSISAYPSLSLPPQKNAIWPRDLSELGSSPLTWLSRRLSKSRSSNSKSPASNVWTLWCPSSPHSSWNVPLR